MAAIGLLSPITAEISQIAIDFRQSDGADKGDIHVHNGNLIPGQLTEAAIPGLLEIAEEIS